MEDIRKACGWKLPRAPSVKWLWRGKATEVVLDFLRGARVGCISTRRKPPEEECDGEGEELSQEEDEGGRARPEYISHTPFLCSEKR